MTPTAIDLFSGAGGASLGLVRTGWDLRLASDFNQACSLTHQANLPGEFITGDLRDVDAAKVMTAADVAPGELDVMFAGPPCQGFSIIGSRVVWDKRNNLFREVIRLAPEVKPRCVVIENVPGLVTLAGGAYLRAILQGLDEAGYDAACAELLAAQYGAPQMRWRLIIIGWRKDLGIPAGYGFPQPTAGKSAIGDLLPNVTIPQWQLEGFVTTAQAIGDLPPVEAGEEATKYVGPPTGPYQELMRAGLGDELSNHYAARLSEANLTRLRHIKPGQDWRDLPHELLPAGMQRALRKDHTRRYRRMTWDGIPRGRHREVRRDRTPDDRHARQLQSRGQGAHQRAGPARRAFLRAACRQSRVGGPEDRGAKHLQRLQADLLPDRVQVPGDQAGHGSRLRPRAAAARVGLLAALPRRTRPPRTA